MRMMTGTLVLAMAAVAAAQTTAEEARRKLAAQKISVQFQETSLGDAIAFLRDATGLNFHLGATVADHAPDATVHLKLRDVSAKTVLRFILDPHDLSATWKDGVIVIKPRGESVGTKTMRIYDARALLLKLPDFPGPTVELVDPDSATTPITGITISLNDPEPPINEDVLTDLVMMNTGGDSWDADPDASITLANGQLVVTQSASVHREIASLLRKLEQYR